MDVLREDVDMVEKMAVHEVPVAFLVVAWETGVFVEVEGDDVLETESFLLVKADQFCVEGQRRTAGSESQHGGFSSVCPGTDELAELGGKRFRGGLWRFKNDDGNLVRR